MSNHDNFLLLAFTYPHCSSSLPLCNAIFCWCSWKIRYLLNLKVSAATWQNKRWREREILQHEIENRKKIEEENYGVFFLSEQKGQEQKQKTLPPIPPRFLDKRSATHALSTATTRIGGTGEAGVMVFSRMLLYFATRINVWAQRTCLGGEDKVFLNHLN